MDLSRLTREDMMVFVAGVVLFIGLLAFDWYSVGPFGATAVSSPYAVWGILALIVTIVVVGDLALARFSHATAIPTTPLGRDMTRVAMCGLLLLLLLIKFLAHVGDFGYGFYIDVICAVVVSAGAWLTAQGRTTPVGAGAH